MTGKADAVNFMYRFKYVIALALVAVLVTAQASNVYSVSPSNVTTYSKWTGVNDYSYIIFTDGSTYYGKNGNTGAIDYSGTSAATVIQNAINALTSGGKVLIKAGTYTITANIKPKSNVVLQGEGIDITILRASGTLGVISKNDNTPMSNFYLMDMTLDGNNTVTGAVVNFNNYATNFNIIRCKVMNAGTNFLAFKVGNVFDSIFYDVTPSGSADMVAGIYNGSRIMRNTFQGGNAQGLTNGGPTSNITISDNTFLSIPTKAISLESGVGKISDYIISNNIFRGSGDADIQIFNSGFAIGNLTITGNFGTSYLNLGTNGKSHGNLIAENTFKRIQVNGDRNLVANNKVINNDSTNGIGAISVYEDTQGNRIIGNYVAESSENGIWVRRSDNNTIIGNLLYENGRRANNTYDGIAIIGFGPGTSDNNQISGNTVITATTGNKTRYGINHASGSNNIIMENELVGTFGTASMVLTSATTTIANQNKGFVTEAKGTGTINSGSTSVVITHGLSYTPTAGDLTITFTNNPTNNPGNWWISSITSTQFTVNVRSDPGASTLTFNWAARRV